MLIERLSEKEKKTIDFLRHNFQDYFYNGFFKGEFVDVDTFLRYWEGAKAPLAKAFGDTLILSKPISSVVDEEELNGKMNHLFWTSEYRRLRDSVCTRVETWNERQWNFRTYKDPNDTANIIEMTLREVFNYYVFDIDAWIHNKYDGPTCEVCVGAGKVLKLVRGCKLMKILGRFAKECGRESEFEFLRLRQSQVLNEARFNAELCLSIHPLDYMTASFNANDWRSCMCWEDGEFRRGVIEMMNSPMVVVAYIASNSAKLYLSGDGLEWNSKRWREFFIVTPDMISGIKGYPYWNRALEDEALTWLRQLFAPTFGVEYSDKLSIWKTNEAILNAEDDIYFAPRMQCGPAMYNDFYDGNQYHSFFRKGLQTKGRTIIFYSGASECVCCGCADDEASFLSESYLCCDKCAQLRYCDNCGCSIENEDDYICVNGRCYCRYCYENLPACDSCGNVIDTNWQERIFDFVVGWDKETKTDLLTDRWGSRIHLTLCEDCVKEYFTMGSEILDMTLKTTDDMGYYTPNYPVVPLEYFTESAKEHLFFDSDLRRFIERHNTGEASA